MPPKTPPLQGFCICISGKLESGSRADIQKQVVLNGGDFANSVTTSVTHLVTTPAEVSSETKKVVDAKKRGAEIVSEDWLVDSMKKKKAQPAAKYSLVSGSSTKKPAGQKKKTAESVPTKNAPKRASAKKRTAEPGSESDAEPSPPVKKQKIDKADDTAKVKVIVKGRAPVDQYSGLVDKGHILDEGDTLWTCMLNQTNIAQNNNKFYVIQLVESDKTPHEYWTLTRWGRVGDGERAAKDVKSFGGNKESAKALFCKKFKDKTKNSWDMRDNFVSYSGKYTLIEQDHTAPEDDEEETERRKTNVAAKAKIPSKLPPKVQNLIKLIFDMNMMEATLSAMEYDVKKMPLGKLGQNTIRQGYEVLKEIDLAIKNNQRSLLTQLSSQFYTYIPHSYPRHVAPPVIATQEVLKQKVQMLDALTDCEIAAELIKDAEESDEKANMLDVNYHKLKADIDPLEEGDPDLDMINKYVQNTYEGAKPPKLVSAYRLERSGEAKRFKQSVGNRALLWHGSRLSNFVGIISQGLRIAPPEAPASGYRFGKGLYFADMMSLSSRYCRSMPGQDFCMILCDVALGKPAKLARDQFMTKAPAGHDSTWALGTKEPNPKDKMNHADGFTVPYGKPVQVKHDQHVSCYEHQYIVYDVAQVQMKYLLHLK
eukprot:Rmarinus@m.20712